MTVKNYFFILIGCVLIGGWGYGLYHDFTPEYEAQHPVQYDVVLYDDKGQPIRHSRKSTNYVLIGNKLVPLTPLDEEGMKIQKEQGCKPCHEKK